MNNTEKIKKLLKRIASLEKQFKEPKEYIKIYNCNTDDEEDE